MFEELKELKQGLEMLQEKRREFDVLRDKIEAAANEIDGSIMRVKNIIEKIERYAAVPNSSPS